MSFGYFFSCITREKDKCIHIRYVEFLYNGMVLETRLLATVFLSYIQLVMIGLLNNSKNKWQILCFRKRKMEKKRRWYEVWDICESISGSDPSLFTATRQFSPGLLLLIWPDILSFISFILCFLLFCNHVSRKTYSSMKKLTKNQFIWNVLESWVSPFNKFCDFNPLQDLDRALFIVHL